MPFLLPVPFTICRILEYSNCGQINLSDVTKRPLYSLESGNTDDVIMILHARIQSVPVALLRGLNGRVTRPITHLHLVPRLKLSGATSPVHNTSSWCTQTLLYNPEYCNLAEHRDSSVGMATRYGLDGPRIESRWGRDFPHPSRPAPRPIQPPVQWVPGLLPEGKAAGAWRLPPTPIQGRG